MRQIVSLTQSERRCFFTFNCVWFFTLSNERLLDKNLGLRLRGKVAEALVQWL